MEQNIELIKEIREAYAKEEGYKSFASMASNVNIVPRDISEVAKRYAAAMNSALQARCDRHEKALREIKSKCEDVEIASNYTLEIIQEVINEALSGEEEKEVSNGTT